MSERKLTPKTMGLLAASSLITALFGAMIYVTFNSDWHPLRQFIFALCYFGMFGLLHCALFGLPLLAITRNRIAWSFSNLCFFGMLTVVLPWGAFIGTDWMIFGRANILQAYLIGNLAGLGIVGGAIFWLLLRLTAKSQLGLNERRGR